MKNINKNFIGGVLAVMILLGVGLGCNQYGTKLEFNNAELYYTDNVTETEARNLGEFLVKEGFFSDREISVQLDKSGATYQFRLVVKPGLHNDEEYLETVRQFGESLRAGFFKNAPLEIHLCDDKLKTLRVVKV